MLKVIYQPSNHANLPEATKHQIPLALSLINYIFHSSIFLSIHFLTFSTLPLNTQPEKIKYSPSFHLSFHSFLSSNFLPPLTLLKVSYIYSNLICPNPRANEPLRRLPPFLSHLIHRDRVERSVDGDDFVQLRAVFDQIRRVSARSPPLRLRSRPTAIQQRPNKSGPTP